MANLGGRRRARRDPAGCTWGQERPKMPVNSSGQTVVNSGQTVVKIGQTGVEQGLNRGQTGVKH